jgi:septal ring factor EnvC (AmiA/AmiB activator)
MSTITRHAVPASNPSDNYRRARSEGRDHETAVRLTCHAYQRRPEDLEPLLQNVRADYERALLDVPQDADAEYVIGEPDPLDAFEAEIGASIAELEAQRSSLALDALSDKAKHGELEKIEARLVGNRAELARVGLAREEVARRSRVAEQDDERERRQAAAKLAERLGKDLPKLVAAIEETCSAYAAALAAYRDAFSEHERALGVASGGDGSRTPHLSSGAFESALKLHLAAAGASDLIELPPGMPRPL